MLGQQVKITGINHPGEAPLAGQPQASLEELVPDGVLRSGLLWLLPLSQSKPRVWIALGNVC